jgi:hypothetical protein
MRLPVIALVPVCACLLSLLCGCGESDPLGRHAISGSVSLDGAPVEKGNISFHPTEKGVTSSGAVINAGKYSIAREKGLPVGEYRVTINAPKPGTGGQVAAEALPGDPVPPPQELIPPEWNVNSEQFIEVTDKGPFEFKFEVKSKGK